MTPALSRLALAMVACSSVILAACGGGTEGMEGRSALIAVSVETAGTHCEAGGQQIASGLDGNANGVLDATEIANTQYVCHGTTGAAGAIGAVGSTGPSGATGPAGTSGAAALATLVQMNVEPVGTHCTTGGTSVTAGLDANTNGALDSSEISSTAYVCSGAAGVDGTNGATGASGSNGSNGAVGSNGHDTLMRLVAEGAGVHCANSGSKVSSGLDANRNGVLDAPEVTSTAYACQGSNGAAGSNGRASLLATVAEAPGVNCAAGGSKLTSGLDTNGNGTLEIGEVTSTAYVCKGAAGATGTNGTNGSNGTNGTNGYTTLALSVPEPAGSNCAAGGLMLSSGEDLSRDGVLDLGEVTATSYACNGLAAIGWVDVTSLSVQADPNTGYVADNNALVTIQLPPSSALNVGDIVRVSGAGTGGWKIAQNANQSIVTTNLDVTTVAKDWTGHGISDNYRSVASSSDGNRLVAAAYNSTILTSADAGLTWLPSGPAGGWTGVASSADGSRLVAVGFGTSIYLSADYGATWMQAGNSGGNWQAVASSADGRVLVAVGNGSQINVSLDYGSNWTAQGPGGNWSTVAISADGSRIIAADNGGTVNVSNDIGVTWSSNAVVAAWRSVTSSADGRRLVAVAEYAPIYTSDDFGVTWTARETARFWTGVTSSSDGNRLVAVVGYDQNAVTIPPAFIYSSGNHGSTWAERGTDDGWISVASSADGSRLVAVTIGGQGISTSVPSDKTATTPGINGGIIGRQHQAMALQFVGHDTFNVLDSTGSGFEAD